LITGKASHAHINEVVMEGRLLWAEEGAELVCLDCLCILPLRLVLAQTFDLNRDRQREMKFMAHDSEYVSDKLPAPFP
jgi:hypothetical protein